MANGPFTQQDFEDLLVRLKDLDEADRLIDQSIRAGLDMTDQQKRSRELRVKLQQIRQGFFPGQ